MLYVPSHDAQYPDADNAEHIYPLETFYHKCTEQGLPFIQYEDDYDLYVRARQQRDTDTVNSFNRFDKTAAYYGAWIGNTDAIVESILYKTYVPKDWCTKVSETESKTASASSGVRARIRTLYGPDERVCHALVFTPVDSDDDSSDLDTYSETDSELESHDEHVSLYALTKNERESLDICTHQACGFVHGESSLTSHNTWLAKPVDDKATKAYVAYVRCVYAFTRELATLTDVRACMSTLMDKSACTRGSLIRCAIRLYYQKVLQLWVPPTIEEFINRKTFRRGWKRQHFRQLFESQM